MVLITASLMCANQLHLYRDVHALLNAGIDMFHFDIMDGEFVENLALNIDLIKELRSLTHKKFDAHLMVKKPSKYIKKLKEAGINIICFHVESDEDPDYVIDLIKRENLETGLVINPDTPIEKLFPYLNKVEYVMFMTVLPGFAGQGFEPSVLHKIDQLQEFIKQHHINITLIADGSINTNTLKAMNEKGVEIFVGGTSGLFTRDGFNNNLEILKQRDKIISREKKSPEKILIIDHRINTVEQLNKTPSDCGVEVDIRAYHNKLILHHDPLVDGEDFEEFLKHYHHAYIILNIKCEGIEKEVIKLMEKYRIEDYFLLDVTPPFIYKLINQGITKIAARYSEFESIETCLNLKGKLEWIFIDNLTHLPIENDAFHQLRKHFKLCIVSPELLHRDEIEKTKQILKEHPVDAVLTDDIQAWKQ